MHVATSDECYHARGIDWRRINSPNLKIHFKDIYNHLKPDVVIMNYAYDADIIDFNFCKNSVNIIDMLDCITISNKIMDYTREGIEFIQNETSLVDILTKIEKSKYYPWLITPNSECRKSSLVPINLALTSNTSGI